MIPSKIPFAQERCLDSSALELLAEASKDFSGHEIKKCNIAFFMQSCCRREKWISDFKTGFDIMQKEIAYVKKERGEIDTERKTKLENAIQ